MRFHALRDTFASMLISAGLNVVWVSRQMGHSSVNVTLRTSARLFDRRDHAETQRAEMQGRYGTVLERTGGHPRPTGPQAGDAEVADLREIATGGHVR